jgi:uncharacterized surface protein with fasciclin (FAS1) repeats
MKKIILNIKYAFTAALMLALGGCELAGLELQTNTEYVKSSIDPNINMTAWEFINKPRPDTLFAKFIRGVKYAGLEAEFSKPNRTFFILTNGAIAGNTASYWRVNKVGGKDATRWSQYPVEQVRELFLYHIVDGMYSYDNIKPDNIEVTTLATDPAKNKMYLKVGNDRDMRIRINEIFNAIKTVDRMRTGNIRATNGVVHVMDNYAIFGVK